MALQRRVRPSTSSPLAVHCRLHQSFVNDGRGKAGQWLAGAVGFDAEDAVLPAKYLISQSQSSSIGCTFLDPYRTTHPSSSSSFSSPLSSLLGRVAPGTSATSIHCHAPSSLPVEQIILLASSQFGAAGHGFDTFISCFQDFPLKRQFEIRHHIATRDSRHERQIGLSPSSICPLYFCKLEILVRTVCQCTARPRAQSMLA
ncbi:hypothetical protein LIA77_05077 [Sarocladium implicatum]|nr:hypothetical protein LIA77_05077 [Sarocladium implicatum]